MANGIIEKGKSGLFENEIEFNGKYANMIRFLKEEVNLFNTFREAYLTAAIVGFINNRCELLEDEEKVQPASIFPSELSKRKKDLRFVYRMIMLLKEEDNFSIDDYKNRTFKDDAEENFEILRENMKIFNSYACGGIEHMYEKFANCNTERKVVDTLYDCIHTFGEEIGLIQEDKELPDFEPDFN